MATREHGDGGEHAELIVSGRVAALRELAEPPPLDEEQLRIVHWYEQLVRMLAGPRTGDGRGPATQPPWVRQGPRVDGIQVVVERDERVALLEGGGFDSTYDVWVDGRSVESWQVVSAGRLSVAFEEAAAGDRDTEILVRTRDGDVAARIPADVVDVE